MTARFVGYTVVKQEGTRMQIEDKNGNLREVEFTFARDLATNALVVVVTRHYCDPDSIPWFNDSEIWTEEETRGQQT